jgi:cobalt/nickel transport system permease protein
MHIPDGFLTPEACAIGAAAGAAGVAVCLRGAAKGMRERDLPLAGLAAAFFLVGDAPIVPVGMGTQAHLLGGTLAVALLGPYLGALTIAVVCAIQVLFGDGGITTLGLTVTNLALVPAFVGYPILLALRRVLPLAVSCAITAAINVMVAALIYTAEVLLFANEPLNKGALAATTLGAYAVVACIEAVITGLVVRALLGVRPDLVTVARKARA